MQIQNLPLNMNALIGSDSTSGDANTTTKILSGTDPLANENTFLQLMVAQLKNQDPLQPTDGAQFLGQLAQFSQLEQLMGIRQDLESKGPSATTTATTAS